jgi:hypothetical protein
MTASVRTLEVRFQWKRLPARVDVRPKAGWREKLEEAVREGQPIPSDSGHEVLTYSFKEVHRAIQRGSGVYLVEAFHTDGGPLPNPGSTRRKFWSEVVDAYQEADDDRDYEPPHGRDPLWFYDGRSVDLKRRFEEHEQKSSALFRHVTETVSAEDSWLCVSLQHDQRITYGGELGSVDLDSDLVRVLLEHAGIADYRREHPVTPMVNMEKIGSRRREPYTGGVGVTPKDGGRPYSSV